MASVFVLGLAGCYLGEAAVTIAGLAVTFLLAAALVGIWSIWVRRISVVGFVAAAVIVQVFFWNTMEDLPFWPELFGDVPRNIRSAGVPVLLLLATLLARWVSRPVSTNTSQRIEDPAT